MKITLLMVIRWLAILLVIGLGIWGLHRLVNYIKTIDFNEIYPATSTSSVSKTAAVKKQTVVEEPKVITKVMQPGAARCCYNTHIFTFHRES